MVSALFKYVMFGWSRSIYRDTFGSRRNHRQCIRLRRVITPIPDRHRRVAKAVTYRRAPPYTISYDGEKYHVKICIPQERNLNTADTRRYAERANTRVCRGGYPAP
ncbi:hypothetical protein EVAR_4796_1 [Eumeta japonica]|uniref:Uncharacterized protein n=1 Tax=Eumeta variegata TaxID=151549 RepID=A0A4C1T1U2_EUMVA|nr:hypothetical protein EVAR_4796_1 [Eumeta japonica]